MAFKKAAPSLTVPDSPEKLFLDLPRRKIPDVMPHQNKIMRLYATKAIDLYDVALQLPTGSGKTLVGLLIAEWRRRKNRERVVYLCPTRQLVNQVVEQAEEKYGLKVLGFTGKVKEYDPDAKAKYQNGDHVAVTTYNSLFNTNPFFSNADILIIDDAHVAENYVASLWNVEIDRNNPQHAAIHAALRNVLKSIVGPINFARLSGQAESIVDVSWVDKIATPKFQEIHDQVVEILDAQTAGIDLEYPWSMIRENLHGCQLYISSQKILIRPLIPPTWTHSAFTEPKQRIYMSATLGAGGDLERLMGRKNITRLQVPDGWDRHGVGRRFFIFPNKSLREEDEVKLRRKLMKRAGRSLVLVPSEKMLDTIREDVNTKLKFQTFSADDIEKSKEPFTSEDQAVAIVANRYDGIDFPGDECRLLFIEGLPKAMNIQERFLMSRMGSTILFNERIQTRVLQAIGRCTRSLEDYSAVVVSGEDLPDYLSDIKRSRYLHPELQAEIDFGIRQSMGTTVDDILENFDIFLENDQAWEDVNQQIVTFRKQATQEQFPALDQLSAIVNKEIDYQAALWQGDYETALSHAEAVLAGITDPDLKGYRALWHYLAGSAAHMGAEEGIQRLKEKSRMHFGQAKNAASAITWLVNLARYQPAQEEGKEDNSSLMAQIERIEAVLAKLGTTHERRFAEREKEILTGLQAKETFENSHKLLGEMLGFMAGKVESRGSPDPWWLADKVSFVFEDHAGAKGDTSKLDVTKARQAASHPRWMQENVPASVGTKVLPVLITPATKVEKDALPHLSEVSIWPLNEFTGWARDALGAIRELRKTFSEPGDLAWRMQAADALKNKGLDSEGLYLALSKKKAQKYLKEVG